MNVQFIELNMWPPNSPNLNSSDYGIWVTLRICTVGVVPLRHLRHVPPDSVATLV